MECCFSSSETMDLLLDAVCIVDAEGRYVYVNAAFERIFGYRPDEIIGQRMIDLVYAEDRDKTLRSAASVMAGRPNFHFENRYVHKRGHIVDVMWSARWSEEQQARIAVARDITARKQSEAVQQAMHAISEATHLATDLPELLQRLRDIVARLLPCDDFRIVLSDVSHGPPPRDEIELSGGADLKAVATRVLRSGVPVLITPEEGIEASGDNVFSAMLGVPLRGQDGLLGAMVMGCRAPAAPKCHYDESVLERVAAVGGQVAAAIERKQLQERLQHSALYDPLTDLPNRRLFNDRLQTAVAFARRDNSGLSMLYLDIDLFKEVNDIHGHGIGDLLLQEVAARLRQCVRASDTVGRVGGDEFLLLLNGIGTEIDALAVAENIRAALCQSFQFGGNRLEISPSIGIAIYPAHAYDYRQLIRYADEAMYCAKRDGGNRIGVWRPLP